MVVSENFWRSNFTMIKKVSDSQMSQYDLQENGQSLVEFAISLVILLVMLAGLVDTGRALFTYLALRESAEEGALFGSIDPTNNAAIQSRALNSSDLIRGLNGNVTVQVIVTGTACTGNAIAVTVTYANFPITMPFLGAIIGSQTIPMSASATNTILRPGCT